MATRPVKKAPLTAASGVVLYSLHFFFDAFGATRPIRLGIAVALALALDEPAKLVLATMSVAQPTGFVLEYSLFGISFCVCFLPLLLRPTMPEPIVERFVIIEEFAKKIGLSKGQKQLLYLDLLELMLKANKDLAHLDLSSIRDAHQAKLISGIKPAAQATNPPAE
jgi:hypothetical protein